MHLRVSYKWSHPFYEWQVPASNGLPLYPSSASSTRMHRSWWRCRCRSHCGNNVWRQETCVASKKNCVGNEYFSKGMLMVALVRWSHYLINDAYSLQPWNSTCKLLPSKEKSNPLARLHDVHKAQCTMCKAAQCTRNKAQGCTMYDGKTKQSIKISKGDKGFLPMRWSFGRIRRSIKMKQRISSQWTCG